MAGADGSRRPKPAVAHLKLAWWQEEIQRLIAGSAGSSHLCLSRVLAARRCGRVHAAAGRRRCRRAARGRRAAGARRRPRTAGAGTVGRAVGAGIEARRRKIATCRLAALHGGRSRRPNTCRGRCATTGGEARVGRVPFAVDELMAAGVENADLMADTPPPHLRDYLDRVRERRRLLRYRGAGIAACAARRASAPAGACSARAASSCADRHRPAVAV